MSFKIIALEIGDNCGDKHVKNLKKNQIYLLDKDFNFSVNPKCGKVNTGIAPLLEGNCPRYIISKKTDSIDLYSDSEKIPKINISAIVGKNGSGKSTLVDLIIKAMNNLFYAYKEDVKSKSKSKEDDLHDVKFEKELDVYIYFEIEDELYLLHMPIKEGDYTLCKYKGNYSESKLEAEKVELDFNNLFYTQVTNYSSYAYNSDLEGDWIEKIFHKNDGYQTPIVLNPFRKYGNINIGIENYLVTQRLLANNASLFKTPIKMGDNLVAASIEVSHRSVEDISLKEYEAIILYSGKEWSLPTVEDGMSKEKKKEIEEERNNEVKKQLEQYIPFERAITKKINEQYNIESKSGIAIKYLASKMLSITQKYSDYRHLREYLNFAHENPKYDDFVEKFLTELENDNSHITLKFRQTLSYLRKLQDGKNIYPNTNVNISFEELSMHLNASLKEGGEKDEIINHLPPPIFDVKILLKPSAEEGKSIEFDTLSSGEKQNIYSINTILYHILNIESVHRAETQRIRYNYINLILEEIELYFHPEYQRTYINNLLEAINKLELIEIKGINIIFVTHSPFILSDIPQQNILKLDNGNPILHREGSNTFGANIHDLLANDFFLEGGFIGEFAKNKIQEVIDFIQSDKTFKKNLDVKIKYYTSIIELIGEPVLKQKLFEMLYLKHPDFNHNNESKKMQVEMFMKRIGYEGKLN